MKFASALITFFSLFVILSCDRKECQTPPPTYEFAFVNTLGQAVIGDSSQAATVRLISVSSAGLQTAVRQADFKPAASTSNYKFVYTASYNLFSKSEQSQYTVEVGGKQVGTLRLTSQLDDSECNGWMRVVEANFNNQPITRDMATGIWVYALAVNL